MRIAVALDWPNISKSNLSAEIHLLGLALDYCVKFSVFDARQLGLSIYVILDGCRGIALQPDDLEKALQEMRNASATIVSSG